MAGERLGERIERSLVGHIAIVVGIVVVLVAEVGTHLPASSLRQSLQPTAQRVAQLTATEQTWAVFAPDPRRVSLDLYADITFEDGTTERWTLPEGPIIAANLRFYRWRKWIESARADAQWRLWDPTARWIASLYDGRTSPVARVDLVRRFHDNVIDGPQPPWRTYTYYSLHLALESAR